MIHPSSKFQGFTLIELITTLAIMGILAINFLPKFLEIKIFKEVVFQKKIFNSLIYAQSLAMYSGCHIAVNTTTETFNLALRSNCQTGEFNHYVADPNNSNKSYIITAPKNVTLTSNNFPIYFDHNGEARLLNNYQIVNASININGEKIQQNINIYGYNGLIK